MSEVKEEMAPQNAEQEAIDPDIEKTLQADVAINKFLGGDKFVNEVLGVELKPVTLSSLALMQEAGCEIISGVDVNDMENLMLEILLFVYIYAEDHKVLTRLACSKNGKIEMRERAFSLGLDISPKEIPKIVGQIVEILTDATSTKVDPMPDEDEVMEGKKKENAEES